MGNSNDNLFENTTPTNFYLSQWDREQIEKIIKKGLFPNRSEFLRQAVRNEVLKYLKILSEPEINKEEKE